MKSNQIKWIPRGTAKRITNQTSAIDENGTSLFSSSPFLRPENFFVFPWTIQRTILRSVLNLMWSIFLLSEEDLLPGENKKHEKVGWSNTKEKEAIKRTKSLLAGLRLLFDCFIPNQIESRAFQYPNKKHVSFRRRSRCFYISTIISFRLRINILMHNVSEWE